jgi:penicillin-binding protein 1A
MTWGAVMSYAHKGIELKNIPGIAPNPPPGTTVQAQAVAAAAADSPARPAVLTQRGARVLLNLERMMDDASRALSVADSPAPSSSSATTGQRTSLPQPETFASADGPTRGAPLKN